MHGNMPKYDDIIIIIIIVNEFAFTVLNDQV